MTSRQQATISIYRGTTVLMSVPITEQSRRRCKLMEYDEIYLKFSYESAKSILRGDYIDDEIFGRFFAKEKQLPKYNNSTGGYDYELTFVRSQFMWADYKCALITTLTDDSLYRKEISWKLTSVLANHASQIRANLLSLGLYSSVKVFIQNEIDTLAEAKLIEYNDVDIISALKLICDAYDCEWWAVNNSSNTGIDLYIGKCEHWDIGEEETPTESEYENVYFYDRYEAKASEIIQVKSGDTAEKITPSKGTSSFFNKLYVFGGTTNIPSSYRKDLNFNIDKVDVIAEGSVTRSVYRDSQRPIYKKMVTESGIQSRTMTIASGKEIELEKKTIYQGQGCMMEFDGDSSSIIRTLTTGMYIEAGTLSLAIQGLSYDDAEDVGSYTTEIKQIYSCVCNIEVCLYKGGSKVALYNSDGTAYSGSEYTLTDFTKNETLAQFITDVDIELPVLQAQSFSNGEYSLGVKVTVISLRVSAVLFDNTKRVAEVYSGDSTGSNGYKVGINITGTVKEKVEATLRNAKYSPSYLATILYNNENYMVLFNPFEVDSDETGYLDFYFVTVGEGLIKFADAPEGWGNGSKYQMLLEGTDVTYGLIYMSTPYSYYSNEYDNEDSLFSIGERRLLLPIADNVRKSYLLADGVDESKPYTIIEKSITFEDIYPRCTLKVSEVKTVDRTDTTDYEDNSVGKSSYKQYSVKLVNIDGTAFNFKSTYQQDGTTLALTFITDSELTEAEKAQTYNISNLAGMKFQCSFDGTSEFAISTNEDYGTRLPNTILCPKVGDILVLDNWDVRAMSSLGLISKAENMLKEAGEEYLDAVNDNTMTFDVTMMSDKIESRWNTHAVTKVGDLAHVNDVGANVTARILSFEYKLDIPWDSPQMNIGDTDRYSRLKQIENGIYRIDHKKTGNSYYNTQISSSDSNGRVTLGDLTVKVLSHTSFSHLSTESTFSSPDRFPSSSTIIKKI